MSNLPVIEKNKKKNKKKTATYRLKTNIHAELVIVEKLWKEK